MPRQKGNIKYKFVKIPELHYNMLLDIAEKLNLNLVKTLEYLIHEAHNSLFLSEENEKEVVKKQRQEYSRKRFIP